jgi:hypothetical protein
MSRLFYHVMQDNVGNLLFGVSGTFRLAGTGTLATIYGDEALTVILPNPMTNHPAFGSFKCFLAPGDYDFYMAKAGYTFETLTGVQGGGSMADQDAGNVAITGGNITVGTVTVGTDASLPLAEFLTTGTFLQGPVGIGSGPVPGIALSLTGAVHQVGGQVSLGVAPVVGREVSLGNTEATAMTVSGLTSVATLNATGVCGIGGAGVAGMGLTLTFNKATANGLKLRQTTNDTGPGFPILFHNGVDSACGGISTTATTTAYGTSSDARLKHDVDDLTGELAVIQALRPVRFKWNSDDSDGVGFLAQDVAQHVAGVISGEPDAVNEDGSIKPQMIDYSKLVPFLTGAVKTLAAQVQSLTARMAVLEDALGI